MPDNEAPMTEREKRTEEIRRTSFGMGVSSFRPLSFGVRGSINMEATEVTISIDASLADGVIESSIDNIPLAVARKLAADLNAMCDLGLERIGKRPAAVS